MEGNDLITSPESAAVELWGRAYQLTRLFVFDDQVS